MVIQIIMIVTKKDEEENKIEMGNKVKDVFLFCILKCFILNKCQLQRYLDQFK